VVPLAVGVLFVVDATAGHVAAAVGVLLALGLGVVLQGRRTPARR
jgi:hypothetical protein